MLTGSVEMPIGDAAHLARHGGREERGLPIGRSLPQNPFDIFDEAHAQHLVGFVDHHRLHEGEVQRAAPQMIHDAARRADHDVHAAAQAANLLADRIAAVDGHHAHAAQIFGIAVHGFGHLNRQFARGGQHQRLHGALVQIEPIENGQREGRRFARAGLRLTDEIATCQQQRDRLLLNGGRRFIAHLVQQLDEWRAQAQLGECSEVVRLICIHGKRLANSIARIPGYRCCRAISS